MRSNDNTAADISEKTHKLALRSIYQFFLFASAMLLLTNAVHSQVLPDIRWRKSLNTGSRDSSGNLLGGTEIRSLVAFDGKLFAGNGYWTDRDINKQYLPGAQVFVLDRSPAKGGVWRQDLHLEERGDQAVGCDFPHRRRNIAISVMKAVTFRTDGSGRSLDRPVSLLLAGVWDRCPGMNVFVRSASDRGTWTRSMVIPNSIGMGNRHVRSFALHRDRVTGVDRVFVGTSGKPGNPRVIISGVYDPNSVGGIRWETKAEPTNIHPGLGDRVTSFAEANGKLYAAVCNKIYRRQDGVAPLWHRVYELPGGGCPTSRPGEWGYRGLTTVKGGPAYSQHLLVGMEGTFPNMRRFVPSKPVGTFKELDLVPFLKNGLKREHVNYAIPAYNNMAKITLPSGRKALFIGIETMIYRGAVNTWHGWQRGAWFIVRLQEGVYRLRHICDKSIPESQQRPMVATRTMVESPFPSEKGRVIYAGGFDANHIVGVNHNTAWLYRGVFLK